ncbi:unnamed protein product, partial [Didymodactylos carnosus]
MKTYYEKIEESTEKVHLKVLIFGGIEYIRYLSAGIVLEWKRVQQDKTKQTIVLRSKEDTLLRLTKRIVPLLMRHNFEIDACDLLIELEHIHLMKQFVNKDRYPRICLYLT